MNESQARIVAEALHGETWQSGGGIWLVVFRRTDGKTVMISDEVVCEYEDDEAVEAFETFDSGNTGKVIFEWD